jgi:Putative polyhydroxyalkanoic acid system protein (PHA_gran_rgn)
VRITVSHSQSKEQVIRSIDRSFDDVFRGIAIIPVRLVETRKTWQGSRLIFSLAAKVGFVSTPIKGTVEVTDRDVVVDVDLGLLERLIPATKARESISNGVRGLLR